MTDNDRRGAQRGPEAFAALDPDHEVFPGLTAGDLVYAMTPGPHESLRAGSALYEKDGSDLQRLHWYAPGEPGSYPAVLFVHSGSWAGGDATMYLRYASDLAKLGFVTASMDYRLTPEARWPDPLHDVCAALAWLRADPLGLDVAPASVAVAGGSAGAHLAAMSALAPMGPLSPGELAAAILWYPPLRLATMAGIPEAAGSVKALLGGLDPDLLEAASPLSHVSSQAPPILTMTGDKDPICPAEDVRAFHAALTRQGVSNELVTFPDGMHGFDLTRRWYLESFDRMVQFLWASLPPA